jgi:hypothetical protein|eukprot:COSAG01_NODE_1329_length_10704_cov_34.202074_17_plen_104_part_00
MPTDKTIVTTASITKVKNDKNKRKSRATFESANRISKKVTNGGNIKRKSATLQDDGSLVIAVNTTRNPAGRTRTINNKKRAARKLERMTRRFNKQQNRFNERA